MKDSIWNPAEHSWTRDSHVARFMRNSSIATVAELRARSVADTSWFWDEAMRDMGVIWDRPYSKVQDRSAGFPWTKWWIDGELNIVRNCVDRSGRGGLTALTCVSEDREVRRVSYEELRLSVNRCANALLAAGVKRGDHVGLYAPMRAEMVIAFYATMKIGARIVPIFCGFGEEAVAERLNACKAKLFFAAKSLTRRGKSIDTASIAQRVVSTVPSIERLVFLDGDDWDSFLATHSDECETPALPAEEPCIVIYTSGTTGRPKGTVHTHAGCLAQIGKELRYGFDVREGDTFFWFTDIGWMMGPWELIGCHLYGANVVLFDGAPDHPCAGRLWREIDRLDVRTFGVSPTLIRLLMRADEKHWPKPFGKLQILGSTGEPWDPASYQWFFERVGGKKCPVINISGGTEIIGCHLHPLPVEPLKVCSLGGPGLGMDVDVFDEEGKSVRGSVGHLVCKQPAPSMTKSFLNDDERYLETYFSRFPDTWYHGDWASIDADGQWFLHGRSDDTIKVAGKRVGPAEVESILIETGAVSESAVVGVSDELKGQALVCFVVMRPGHDFDEELLLRAVADKLGKPLRPKKIHAVAALPKTRSGKILRGTIRRVYEGEAAGDLSSVENPAALEAIAQCRSGILA